MREREREREATGVLILQLHESSNILCAPMSTTRCGAGDCEFGLAQTDIQTCTQTGLCRRQRTEDAKQGNWYPTLSAQSIFYHLMSIAPKCEVASTELVLRGMVLSLGSAPESLVARFGLTHSSSSSSIFVSSALAIFPSEPPLSFCAPISAWPKLLRTLSSKPGNEARCFLNGDAMLDCGSGSADLVGAVDDEDASVVVMAGTGGPERGEPDAFDAEGAEGRPRGSAECWRLSCCYVSTVISFDMEMNAP